MTRRDFIKIAGLSLLYPKTLLAGNCSYEEFIFPSGYGYPHEMRWVDNKLFVCCNVADARMIRFNDPLNDLTDYDTLLFSGDTEVDDSDGYHVNALDMCYCTTNERMYVLFNNSSRTVVSKVNVAATPMTYTTETHDTADGCGAGGISQDTDNIFVATYKSPSKILKYAKSNWAKTSNTLSKNNAHSLKTDGTNLYAGHSTSPGAITKISPSDLSYSAMDMETGDNTVTDDLASTDGYLWAGVESTNGAIYKITKSDLSYTKFFTGESTACYGLFYDTGYIWATYAGTPGIVLMIDPSTNRVRRKWTLPENYNHANELMIQGGCMLVSNYRSPGRIIRQDAKLGRGKLSTTPTTTLGGSATTTL